MPYNFCNDDNDDAVKRIGALGLPARVSPFGTHSPAILWLIILGKRVTEPGDSVQILLSLSQITVTLLTFCDLLIFIYFFKIT